MKLDGPIVLSHVLWPCSLISFGLFILISGQLNEYGLHKEAARKKMEGGAGLDANADFDEYTIYDQGQLNEYGLHKEAARKKMEGGAGLDANADFDEYTIYDQGPMNEYGVLKAER